VGGANLVWQIAGPHPDYPRTGYQRIRLRPALSECKRDLASPSCCKGCVRLAAVDAARQYQADDSSPTLSHLEAHLDWCIDDARDNQLPLPLRCGASLAAGRAVTDESIEMTPDVSGLRGRVGKRDSSNEGAARLLDAAELHQ
jgi:hypothetical protein